MANSQSTGKMSPRQKMINLMYIVLTAMLALNVSGDVLNGFQQVEDGLSRSNETSTERNASLLGKLIEFNETNPEKGGIWLKKAQEVKDKTDSLFNHISFLKLEIAKKADGDNGDPKNLKSQDDLEAAAAVMLAPVNSKGTDLRKRIDSYRNYTNLLINDSIKLGNINKILSTMDTSVVNKEEIFSHFKMIYSVNYIPDDKEFTQSVKDYVRDYNVFYNLYNKFVSLFDSDNIKIVWDNETIHLFEKYEKKEMPIDSQYFAEYEVYKYIIPYYRKHFFRKNSNKYKPVIEKLPGFISYATSIYDILFKYNILVDTEDKVRYNEEGDINSAYEEIAKISVN